MKQLSKRQIDFLVLFCVFILTSLSVLTLYTTQSDLQVPFFSFESDVFKQLVFFAISIVIAFVLANIPFMIARTPALLLPALAISLLLLGGLFVFGGLVNATRRWYDLGVFLFQPSEFIKYVAIIWAAFWLNHKERNSIRQMALAAVGPIVLALLIFFQPDAGTAIMMVFTFGVVLIVWLSQFELWRKVFVYLGIFAVISVIAVFTHWLVLLFTVVPLFFIAKNDRTAAIVVGGILLAIGLLGGTSVLLWNSGVILDYQKERILSFVGETEESFQVKQAKIAIGSGGVWGKGIGQGTQSRLRFLPEYKTDFIFSAFVEERGFVGGFLVIILYVVLLIKMAITAIKTKDDFGRLIIVGLIAKLWIEMFINIGMNLGLVPTKGVALPFLSYGGSSLISNYILVGIYLSIYRFDERNDKIMSDTRSFSNPLVEEELKVT